MNLKSVLIVIFVFLMLVFTCVSGNLTFLEKNQVINTENPNSDNRTYVVFCYGKISGLYDFGSGYNHYIFKGFNAEDVICIINYTDRPLYHHITGGVPCAIPQSPFLFGRVTDDFICANFGFIPPRILLLIYYLQQN